MDCSPSDHKDVSSQSHNERAVNKNLFYTIKSTTRLRDVISPIENSNYTICCENDSYDPISIYIDNGSDIQDKTRIHFRVSNITVTVWAPFDGDNDAIIFDQDIDIRYSVKTGRWRLELAEDPIKM